MVKPDGEAQALDTWKQGYDAWRQLLEATEHTLWVLDHDLTGFHLDRDAWPATLQSCLRRLAQARIRILIRDDQPLLTRLPRTRQILVDYGHVVQIRKIATQHASAIQQALVVSDERHILLRPQYDAPRAFLRRNAPADCLRHLPTFEGFWDTAEPISLGTVLGL